MRVFISADIEGCTGLVSWSQCEGPGESPHDWEFAREMMTHDVNAAIRGARAAGATNVVVQDAHGRGKNLLIKDLEPGAELISGFNEGNMMAGLDDSFDAAILIGYHALAGTVDGIMEHALTGGLRRFHINGREAGEILVSAAYGGAHGVPTVMVSSDEAGCEEAAQHIPGVLTAATKRAVARFQGQLLHPSVTGSRIEATAEQAVHSHRAIDPVLIEGACTMRCEFHNVNEADLAATMESVNRIDGYTVEWTRDDYLQAHKAMYNVFALASFGRNTGS